MRAPLSTRPRTTPAKVYLAWPRISRLDEPDAYVHRALAVVVLRYWEDPASSRSQRGWAARPATSRARRAAACASYATTRRSPRPRAGRGERRERGEQGEPGERGERPAVGLDRGTRRRGLRGGLRGRARTAPAARPVRRRRRHDRSARLALPRGAAPRGTPPASPDRPRPPQSPPPSPCCCPPPRPPRPGRPYARWPPSPRPSRTPGALRSVNSSSLTSKPAWSKPAQCLLPLERICQDAELVRFIRRRSVSRYIAHSPHPHAAHPCCPHRGTGRDLRITVASPRRCRSRRGPKGYRLCAPSRRPRGAVGVHSGRGRRGAERVACGWQFVRVEAHFQDALACRCLVVDEELPAVRSGVLVGQGHLVTADQTTSTPHGQAINSRTRLTHNRCHHGAHSQHCWTSVSALRLRPWKWCSGWDLFRGFAPASGLVPA